MDRIVDLKKVYEESREAIETIGAIKNNYARGILSARLYDHKTRVELRKILRANGVKIEVVNLEYFKDELTSNELESMAKKLEVVVEAIREYGDVYREAIARDLEAIIENMVKVAAETRDEVANVVEEAKQDFELRLNMYYHNKVQELEVKRVMDRDGVNTKLLNLKREDLEGLSNEELSGIYTDLERTRVKLGDIIQELIQEGTRDDLRDEVKKHNRRVLELLDLVEYLGYFDIVEATKRAKIKKAPSLEEIEIHDKIVEASIDQGEDKLRESILKAILDPKAPLDNIRGIDVVEIIYKASKSHLVSMVEYSDGMARGVAKILKELGINYDLATIKLQALNNWNLRELQVVEGDYYKYKKTLIGFISYVEAREGLSSKVALKRRLEERLAHIERLLDHIDDLKDFF